MFRPVIFTVPLVLALGLAACDGEDYEARIGELESELQTARTESEQMRTELEEARARGADMEQAQPQEGAGRADAAQSRWRRPSPRWRARTNGSRPRPVGRRWMKLP